MNLFIRDDARPGIWTLRAGIAAYVATFMLSLAINPDWVGVLLLAPILIAMLALLSSPFVFLTSMLWGLAPLDFALTKAALKRNYRGAWGIVLLLSASLAIVGAIMKYSRGGG